MFRKKYGVDSKKGEIKMEYLLEECGVEETGGTNILKE